MWSSYANNQKELLNAVLSLDVEEGPDHLYDEYKLMGIIPHDSLFVELFLRLQL